MATTDTTLTTTRRTRSSHLATGLAALVAALALFMSAAPEPEDGQSGAALRRFYESHLDAAGIAVLGATVAVVAFVLFVVGVRRLMVDAGVPLAVTDLATVSGTLVTLWFWVAAAQGAMPGVMANDSGKLSDYDDQALAHLDLFSRFSETFADVGMSVVGLFVLAVSWGAVRSRFMPRWIGHVGLVVAAGCGISLLGAVWNSPVTGTGFFLGLFGFVLWMLMTAVTLIVSGARRRH